MIVIIRLKDGSEVVGTIENETEKGFTLKNAMVLKFNFSYSENKPVVYLTRFASFSVSNDVHFNLVDITHIFRDVMESFLTHYERSIKNIIQTENKGVQYQTADKKQHDIDSGGDELINSILDYEEQEEILNAYEEILSGNTSIN